MNTNPLDGDAMPDTTGPVVTSTAPLDITKPDLVPGPIPALNTLSAGIIPADNIPAPAFVPADTIDDYDGDTDKLDYLYQMAKRIEGIVNSITPEQVERVNKLASNPLLSRMFGKL